uniref:C2 calcium dependent domain containing 2 n=1 Tax=Takifugu rubripes TaxID=31033 RepID=H2RZ19_TAKRU
NELKAAGVSKTDPQWLLLVTLFIASLGTLGLYLLQYFQQRAAGLEPRAQDHGANEEAASLLGWALSRKSWKSKWREAWRGALSGPVVLTFEENGLEATELVVSQVHSFHKSATNTAFSCRVTGEKLRFSVGAALTSGTPGDPCTYTVCVAPLTLQVLQIEPTHSPLTIQAFWNNFVYDHPSAASPAAVRTLLRQLLCAVRPSVVLSHRSAQASEVKEVHNNVLCPPKPPRAHDWKLLVKNIQVTLNQQEDAAGSISPFCVLQLDDPPQKFNTSVLVNTSHLAWEQPFIFELNGLSKELNIDLITGVSLGQVSVTFDLVKKQPNGQQTFALVTKDGVSGSLTTEFTYLEPSEVRSWHPPTPAYNKRVEMDRTVMPCGTVVTTVTAVKSKPGRPLPPGPILVVPAKSKLSGRRVSEQASMLGTSVSKALSSSDTELLMLNGADPVAEAAIRQLHQSAKQKLKSPVKKSTIIISGIAKTPLSQDEELALMAGYAAAMDASMMGGSSSQDVTTLLETGAAAPPEESASREGAGGPDVAPEDWESQTDEVNHSSLSMCVSEGSCRKSRGSFLQKSAKFFFRRRHQRKDPGMSQSHNDLVYLESPAAVERAGRTATINRLLHRRSKTKSKANGSVSAEEPHM